jgi:hypothetical protein
MNCDKHKLREFVTKILGEIYSVSDVAIYSSECWALTKCEKLKLRKFVLGKIYGVTNENGCGQSGIVLNYVSCNKEPSNSLSCESRKTSNWNALSEEQ